MVARATASHSCWHNALSALCDLLRETFKGRASELSDEHVDTLAGSVAYMELLLEQGEPNSTAWRLRTLRADHEDTLDTAQALEGLRAEQQEGERRRASTGDVSMVG